MNLINRFLLVFAVLIPSSQALSSPLVCRDAFDVPDTTLADLQEAIKSPRANPSWPHELVIEDGRVILKIGVLFAEEQGILKAIIAAIRSGAINEIDAGVIVSPKILKLLTSLSELAPNTELIVQGKIDPSHLPKTLNTEIKITKGRRMTPITSDGKRDPHYSTEKDLRDFVESAKKIGLSGACKQIFNSELEGCGEMNFAIRPAALESTEWSVP